MRIGNGRVCLFLFAFDFCKFVVDGIGNRLVASSWRWRFPRPDLCNHDLRLARRANRSRLALERRQRQITLCLHVSARSSAARTLDRVELSSRCPGRRHRRSLAPPETLGPFAATPAAPSPCEQDDFSYWP